MKWHEVHFSGCHYFVIPYRCFVPLYALVSSSTDEDDGDKNDIYRYKNDNSDIKCSRERRDSQVW